MTGPLLRATGDPWDLRKAMPYSSYDHFDFKIPVGTIGDNYDRYRVRMAEMRESLKIVEQALDGLPEGPYITDNRKVALPPRHELATSMEALIHHFKLVTEGFRVPPGEAYVPIESPRGELGCFVLADGSSKPARVHMRDPCFVNLQALPADGRGRPDRRHDRVASRCSTRSSGGSTGEPQATRARSAPPRRRPAGTSAVDLDADPAAIPDPAEVDVPGRAARARSRSYMARYPDRRSAAMPALAAAQRLHGWCSPEAIDQVAAVMQVTPAYLSSVATFYDMLDTEPVGRQLRLRLHERRVHADATRRRSTTRSPEAGDRPRGRRDPRVRVPRRLRHGADGVGRTAATSARSTSRTPPRSSTRSREGAGAARPRARGLRLPAALGTDGLK